MESTKRLILAALAILVIQVFAHADVIFLVDGRLLHVKILAGDARGVSVERLDTRGQLFVKWELLREEDRKRLRVQFGLEEDDSTDDLFMEGHRVFVRQGDYYDGLVEAETQDEIILRRAGKTVPFVLGAVRRVEERRVSVFDVYTPEELYQQRFDEIAPTDDDVVGHFEMARWATKVEMYHLAIDHYIRIQQMDPEYKVEYIANQLERLKVLDRNKQIFDTIRQADVRGGRKRFNECLAFLDTVLSQPDLTADVKETVEKKKKKFEKRRWEYYATLVVRQYGREVNKRIQQIARDKNIQAEEEAERMTLDKAQTYLRSQLHKDIVAALAERFELDPKKEVETMWQERTTRSKRTTTYGSGTFIVLGRADRREDRAPAGLNPDAAELIERLRQRVRGGQEQQQQQQPGQEQKLITKDKWWTSADSKLREFWMRAFYAEQGGQYEVTNLFKRPCATCGGTGSLKKLAAQGGAQKVTCPRCQGHQYDRLVVYR